MSLLHSGDFGMVEPEMRSGHPMSRFSLYWSSSTASYLGDGVRFAALPLLAASLSSTPTGVALVSVAVGLPWLLFGLLVAFGFVVTLGNVISVSVRQLV